MNHKLLNAINACPEGKAWAEQFETLEEAWNQCQRGDWMLWLLTHMHTHPAKEKSVEFAKWCAGRAAEWAAQSVAAQSARAAEWAAQSADGAAEAAAGEAATMAVRAAKAVEWASVAAATAASAAAQSARAAEHAAEWAARTVAESAEAAEVAAKWAAKSAEEERESELAAQADKIREIFGNPFQNKV